MASCGLGGGRGAYGHANGDLPFVMAAAAETRHETTSSPRPRERYSYCADEEPRLANAAAARVAALRDERRSVPLDTVIMHVNEHGLRNHLAEISAVVRVSDVTPDIECINETFLDDGVEHMELEGCFFAGRRDKKYRNDYRICGGIITYVNAGIAEHVARMHISEVSERLWL